MKLLASIPLFAYLLVIYNAIIFIGSTTTLDSELIAVGLISGATWVLSVADLLIMLGIVALYIETIKATRTNISSVLDHSFSMLVFVLFLVEFITIKGAGNSVFMVLLLMSLLDVVAGFTISIVSARRDVAFGEVDR